MPSVYHLYIIRARQQPIVLDKFGVDTVCMVLNPRFHQDLWISGRLTSADSAAGLKTKQISALFQINGYVHHGRLFVWDMQLFHHCTKTRCKFKVVSSGFLETAKRIAQFSNLHGTACFYNNFGFGSTAGTAIGFDCLDDVHSTMS